MKTYLIVIASFLMLAGCSDSTTPPSGFVLSYTSLPTTNDHYSPPVEVFNFAISNNGKGVAGAMLIATSYEKTGNVIDTLPSRSDANGIFAAASVQLNSEFTGVVFQAVKDSMKSNTVPWQPTH